MNKSFAVSIQYSKTVVSQTYRWKLQVMVNQTLIEGNRKGSEL